MAGGDFDTKINLNRILNKWGKKNSQIWKRFYTSTHFLELKIFSSVTVTTFSLAVKCRTVTQRKTGVYCPTSTSLTLSSFTLLNSTNKLVPVFHPFNDNTVPKSLTILANSTISCLFEMVKLFGTVTRGVKLMSRRSWSKRSKTAPALRHAFAGIDFANIDAFYKPTKECNPHEYSIHINI